MNNSAFTIFIVFGFIWIFIATAAVIALFKSDGQEIRISNMGLIIIIPIILPIIITLSYAAFKGTF
ncbi:hypothetical protein [Sphaerospermopsis torques-reginae]|jgi:hypothetical protein|uniref:Cardiolipin synthase N-terminal domain-containing protein n=1 Tax=Sphaerospermopsis torques-reginae ITEP-024 TaxID=984208 RepID=A0ABX8WYG7_9CYAN|nr:hypothetical protein [Sphaerospermopsis torques-reginae]QYX31430.1 hypothetical protein K2F26_21905 [Sphaerospermopsis torques-reginae ITEP-024]